MPGVVAAGAAEQGRGHGQVTAAAGTARLQQQVGQRIFASLQRTQLVGCHRQHLLEQRQRTVRAVIQALRLQRRLGAPQQHRNAGVGTAALLQLVCQLIGIALWHLQFARQRQRTPCGVQVARVQRIAGLLQRRLRRARQAGAGLAAVPVQRQCGLVPLPRAAAVGCAQAAGGQRAIALVQQLFDLGFVPEPVGQGPPQQHQCHEQQHGHQQRPAPHAACMPRLQPPPASFAAHPAQRGVDGVLAVGMTAHPLSLAAVT